MSEIVLLARADCPRKPCTSFDDSGLCAAENHASTYTIPTVAPNNQVHVERVADDGVLAALPYVEPWASTFFLLLSFLQRV
jgi:hypothetical protein